MYGIGYQSSERVRLLDGDTEGNAYPDSVNLVNPPNTTIPNTNPALPSSQYPTTLSLVSLNHGPFASDFAFASPPAVTFARNISPAAAVLAPQLRVEACIGDFTPIFNPPRPGPLPIEPASSSSGVLDVLSPNDALEEKSLPSGIAFFRSPCGSLPEESADEESVLRRKSDVIPLMRVPDLDSRNAAAPVPRASKKEDAIGGGGGSSV